MSQAEMQSAATPPVDHPEGTAADAVAAGCPFHVAGAAARPVDAQGHPRSNADLFMRKLLRVPEGPARANAQSAQRMFSQSILISATRCLITYVLLPIVAPVIGKVSGIGPAVGIPLGLVAMTFDVLAVRRFWLADHRYRWICTGVYAVIISFLLVLMGIDISHLIG